MQPGSKSVRRSVADLMRNAPSARELELIRGFRWRSGDDRDGGVLEPCG